MTAATEWGRLHPLPRLKKAWHRGERVETWEQVAARYAELPVEPLVVCAELLTPVVHAESIGTHLDSILSFAALTAHPMQSGLDSGPCVVPLPLQLAWVSDDGRPLWACSPLMPRQAVRGREYWHKRYPTQRAEFGERMAANTSAGRWREYRVPLATDSAEVLLALCIGNADEVLRLLTTTVSHIGKKGTQGFGRVGRWTVTPAGHTLEDVLALRAVPVEFFAGRQPTGVLAPNKAWTPPYWYAPWWSACMVPA